MEVFQLSEEARLPKENSCTRSECAHSNTRRKGPNQECSCCEVSVLATIVPKWANASFVLLHRAAHTVPEVFINSFEASFLSGQCSSSKNGLQINPAPLDGIQTEQILIQVGQTNFPQTDLDIRGVNTQTFVTVSSSGIKC